MKIIDRKSTFVYMLREHIFKEKKRKEGEIIVGIHESRD